MSKIELLILLIIGFFIFIVVYIRVGFFFGISISNLTLLLAFTLYCLILALFFSIFKFAKSKIENFIVLLVFVISSLLLLVGSYFLSQTFDTSWDGQGYHQSAVIALANGWNPVKNPNINFQQKLPSQIFAEGYPSALWEIEASIYSVMGRINSAKIVNIAIAILASLVVYSLFRKLLFGKIIAGIISMLIVVQPIYILQMLTFMQDGFGYEVLAIAGSSLAIYILKPKEYWAVVVFFMSEILLVSTKYSFLPVALILGMVFLLVVLNRTLNKDIRLNRNVFYVVLGIFLISFIFSYLPYIRNQLAHNAAFFPTNITELLGSVKYNNVPQNIQNENKFSLLFYGIYSKSQDRESGDPRNELNIAELKIPFTFTASEVRDAGGHFNNRVGAGGPLFSGAVTMSLILILLVSLISSNTKERYAIYTGYFCLGVLLFLAVLTPTPNLLRYVSHLQLIPFVVIIPIYVVFKEYYIKFFVLLILLVVATNTFLFAFSVTAESIKDTNEISQQYENMRSSGKEYYVRAQQFYSSYIMLTEQEIPFVMVNQLPCNTSEELVVSSSTTQFCEK